MSLGVGKFTFFKVKRMIPKIIYSVLIIVGSNLRLSFGVNENKKASNYFRCLFAALSCLGSTVLHSCSRMYAIDLNMAPNVSLDT